MISFNVPPNIGKGEEYIKQAITNNKLSGGVDFNKKCNQWFEEKFDCKKSLLITSCTHALEMAAILAGIESGDEVIMPSYTFVSTANAFVLRGATPVFVDIRPDTMNINENLIEEAITKKTKAIVPVHYAGVGCNMDKIMQIADKYDLLVIEDAAQGVMAKYDDKYLGTIGDIGCYSFHETKNYTSGEGGAIVINNEKFIERAEIIREKGTNRSKFFRGQVDKYTWVDIGSSYIPSELNAAYLYPQLEQAEEINQNRRESWYRYYKKLKPLADKDYIDLPFIPEKCYHNAHIFYIKVKNLEERTELIDYLKEKGIESKFHYVPLHTSPAGQKFGRFVGEDKYTTKESERLIRLPLYYNLAKDDIDKVVKEIERFYLS
ncbi:dTDP-4-amino-4,6-dideoxygalactose transaminase [Halanaerobacter jeridensis]|uniref:dTDP-4-amino-4,6-dideoxygalactose transaminase n=1 Tax=Halanaerobacter jeridensis TaxID=706427 RepID=A0A938XVY7_9FIRM|nr:dTDP-4-amino-4,6-dideoxygalactose transaminase [Halanaerobacter jeridensis]MBM7557276.1 dTDP-4-amino-4,6-dideoxygalactose transaminase [Halanaerobacter jeridensis]